MLAPAVQSCVPHADDQPLLHVLAGRLHDLPAEVSPVLLRHLCVLGQPLRRYRTAARSSIRILSLFFESYVRILMHVHYFWRTFITINVNITDRLKTNSDVLKESLIIALIKKIKKP